MIRIPQDIADKYNGGRTLDTDVRVHIYDNGQACVAFTSNGPKDYFVWSEQRQRRLASWEKAADMWRYFRRCDSLGDGVYGLFQLA